MSASAPPLPPRAQAALSHLRRLKPLDGYAIERYLAASGKHQLRLKRRNVPVRDEGFEDIVVERSGGGASGGAGGRVVGIRVLTSRGEAGRGVVLVHADGKVCSGDVKEITVKMDNVATTSASSQTGTGARSASSMSGSRRSSSGISAAAATSTLSDADNQLLMQYGLMALGALLLLKILLTAINILSILLLPILYLYASSNCPTNNSFEAKKELKRVMRGAHLPEEQQPKGFFEQGLNRLAASVTAELATSLGYEMSMTDCLGAAKVASVKVPVAGAEFYWLGVLGKWRYIGQRELPGSKND